MTIDLKPEQQRMIDQAIQSGAFHNPEEVISTALAMLAEDIEDGAIAAARRGESEIPYEEYRAERLKSARPSE